MPATTRNAYCQRCYQRISNLATAREYRPEHWVCQRCLPATGFETCPECHIVFMSGEMSGDGNLCYNCYNRTNYWAVNNWSRSSDNMTELRSLRGFGVEVETSVCENHRNLRGRTVWGAKPDGSIAGVEFVSPVLSGDDGLACLREFMAFSRRNHWRANSDCGLHIHLDMRGEPNINLRHIAYAYALTCNYWRKMVNRYRDEDCSYCHRHSYSADSLITTSWRVFSEDRSRYDGFNWQAYRDHGSLEIRLHQGTVSVKTIVSWVKAHLRFVDFVAGRKFHQIRNYFTWEVPQPNGTNRRVLNAAAFASVLGADAVEHWCSTRFCRSAELRDAFRQLVEAQPAPTRRRRRRTTSAALQG